MDDVCVYVFFVFFFFFFSFRAFQAQADRIYIVYFMPVCLLSFGLRFFFFLIFRCPRRETSSTAPARAAAVKEGDERETREQEKI